jgi:histidine triad (HIT) family protein
VRGWAGRRDGYDAPVTTDCLFCKIVAGEIPSTKVFEDDLIYAFRDITPQASTHVVVVPKEHYPNAAALASADPALAGAVLAAAGEIAALEGVAESGYRMVFNTGPDANQTVFHVHLHVLGGRPFGWPPG